MSRAALLELLGERIGLDGESLGARILDDACADARRTLGVADDEQLLRRMRADPAAFAAAAEHFLVPESWFFRAAEQYDDLVRFAREHRDRRPLRVLSLPCASGEEAYSVVIRLLDAGLSPGDIDVLGIDLSEAAVGRARAGRYRTSALRGQPPVEPWLEPCDGGFQVADAVRQCARFRVGNALHDAEPPGEGALEAGGFDVNFSRNLLIYLHGGARQRLLARLRGLLAEPGLLLAGHAEVVSAMHADFQPMAAGSPLSFQVRPRVAEAATARPVAANSAPATRPAPAPRVVPAPPPVAREDVATPADVLAHLRALADAGRLDEALAGCTRWIARHPADSEALYLLGLVQSALGQHDAADQAFTRVLYLDRDHADALAQRIGLAERFGRADQARSLRARAARRRDREDKPQ
jgi:chemotaxis protein methyltransferase WspC